MARNNKDRSKEVEVRDRRSDRKSDDKKKRSKRMNQAKLDDRGRDNHPGYYVLNPEMAEQASQLAFQSFLGHDSFDNYEIPTVMVMYTNPNPGITVTPGGNGVSWKNSSLIEPSALNEKAGINLMSTKIYALLSTFSGRTATYGPQDVAIMLMAISSVIELAEHIRRAFGILLTYNPRNRTMPQTLLEALGFDAQDLSENVANYRMRFNTAMTRINQIPILDNIAFLHKSLEIFQKIYQDDISSMSQLFAWVPLRLWLLDETSDPNGSMLDELGVPTYSSLNKKMSVHLTYLELMINRLLESSTLNIIYADLLNMGNKLNVPTLQFDYLAENYVVKPEYNENACLQAHNTCITGAPATLASNKATSPQQNVYTNKNMVFSDVNNNAIVYNPVFVNMWNVRNRRFVDMLNDNPKVEDRIEVTRFMAIASGYGVTASDIGLTGQATYSVFPALPDHYVEFMAIFGNDAVTPLGSFYKSGTQFSTGAVQPSFVTVDKFGIAAPMIDSYDAVNQMTSFTGDLHFYTEIDWAYLRRLNDFYCLGLWDFRV